MLVLMMIEALLSRHHHLSGDQDRPRRRQRRVHHQRPDVDSGGAVGRLYRRRHQLDLSPSARAFAPTAATSLRFARDNRHKTKLLGDKDARERVEPFLTGETFHVYFHLIYEIEGDLRILLALILNVIVLGTQIDGSLPVAYATGRS